MHGEVIDETDNFGSVIAHLPWLFLSLDLKLENYSVFTFLLFLDLQDRSDYSELAMELLRSCTKPSIYFFFYFFTTNFFTFSQSQVGKLFRIYVFTFSRPEVGILFRIYVFTFSRPARLQ